MKDDEATLNQKSQNCLSQGEKSFARKQRQEASEKILIKHQTMKPWIIHKAFNLKSTWSHCRTEQQKNTTREEMLAVGVGAVLRRNAATLQHHRSSVAQSSVVTWERVSNAKNKSQTTTTDGKMWIIYNSLPTLKCSCLLLVVVVVDGCNYCLSMTLIFNCLLP
jgi:small-conductance mechanosensitive channel